MFHGFNQFCQDDLTRIIMYFIEYNHLVLEESNIYQNLGDFTRVGDFTWKVSHCEELVGASERAPRQK